MNKNSRVYIILLALLVAVFAIIKLSNNSTEHKIRFFDVDSIDVTEIEIYNNTDTLKIKKTGNDWMVVYPIQCEITERNIDEFFTKVLPVETSSIPVSESEASHDKYNVSDSLGTVVRLLNNNQVIADAIVGKSSNYNFSHGRRPDEDKVYQLDTNISYNLNPDLKRWRKKEIIEIPEEEQASVRIQSIDGSITLTASDSLWIFSDEEEEFAISENNSTLRSIKTNIKRMIASDFIDDNYDEYSDLLAEPELMVTITDFSDRVTHLKFAPYEDKKYILQVDEKKDPLYIVYDHLINNFKKIKDDYRK